jgi:hypothetical protein
MGLKVNAPCVRTLVTVRRVQRHPLTQKTLRTVQRQVTLGLVPSGLNDLVFHHARASVDEMTHLVTDQATISATAAALVLVWRWSKRIASSREGDTGR